MKDIISRAKYVLIWIYDKILSLESSLQMAQYQTHNADDTISLFDIISHTSCTQHFKLFGVPRNLKKHSFEDLPLHLFPVHN